MICYLYSTEPVNLEIKFYINLCVLVSLVLNQHLYVYLTCIDNVQSLLCLTSGPQEVDGIRAEHTHVSLPPNSALFCVCLCCGGQKQFDTPQRTPGISAVLSSSVIILLISLHSSHSP